MNFSRDAVLALQRHYLGALSTPARTWLEPLPPAHLAFAGSAIRSDREGCVLDFGTVDTSEGERRTIRVFRPGDRPAAIRVDEVPAWLRADWCDGAAGAALAVQIVDDAEGERAGTVTLWVRDDLGARLETLRVRIAVRPRNPVATIIFNGSTTPHAHDFGTDGGDYTIAVANRTSVPLVVRLADLPDWLELVVDGCSRRGPVAGVFFERTAPFRVVLRPRLLGRQSGSLRMQTNDPRPELCDIELHFTACVAPVRPHVRALGPPPLAIRSPKTAATQIRLENQGRSPARVTSGNRTPSMVTAATTVVPGARDGQPGTAVLPIRIQSSQLSPGPQVVPIDLHVDGGDPSEVRVLVHVTVASRQRRELRPEMIAALLALLLLTAVLFVAARGLP
ncbi:MAG: hypothetical protein ACXW31_10110 [Thermoanaerobaculia bacterium]